MFSTWIFFISTVLNIVVHYLRKHQEEGHGERKVSSSCLSSDQLCRHFSLWQIKLATHNFDEALVIGKGGFGKVYKGTIDHGSSTVAIKRLNSDSNQGAAEFWAEIKMLSLFRHSHIVSLLGYCESSQEKILVYEYMPHGSLQDHLRERRDGRSGPQLTWIERLKICIGAARGLDYLQTGTSVRHRVIHRDIKSSNILLDDNWEAKVSDFGLSRMSPANHSCTTNVYTNQIRGTFGYMDAEYFLTHRLTRKSDVYAFGVVLFEVLCGRPAVDLRLVEEQRSLAGWAKNNIKEGKLDQIIDPCLGEKIVPDCLKEFGEIAYKCLLNRPKERPTMAEVVARLELALSLQEASTLKLQAELATTSREDDEDVGSINEGSVSSLSDAVIVSTEQIKVHADKHPATSSISHGGRVAFIKKAWSLFSTLTPANTGHESLEAWRFAFKTIKVATGNFSNANTLTNGDYISVYKGILQNGQQIAVKRLTRCEYTDIGPINQLLWRLTKLQHRNVTRFMGFCVEGKKMYLIQEFMPRGTLKDELVFDGFREALMGWFTRYNIIVGLAHALLYLETELPLTVPLNIRREDILLDEHLNPKISSWAVAGLLSPYDSQTYLTQEIINYMDIYTSQPSPKIDVYNYGVLILQILNGRSDCSPLQHVWRYWDEGTSIIFLHKAIHLKPTEIDQALRCLQIALLCVQIPGDDRPTMASIVHMLTNANVILPAPKNPYDHILNSDSDSDMVVECQSSGEDGDLTKERRSGVYEDFITQCYSGEHEDFIEELCPR